jgi:hypothetical protein
MTTVVTDAMQKAGLRVLFIEYAGDIDIACGTDAKHLVTRIFEEMSEARDQNYRTVLINKHRTPPGAPIPVEDLS